MSRTWGITMGMMAAAVAAWWIGNRRSQAMAGSTREGEVIFTNRPLA